MRNATGTNSAAKRAMLTMERRSCMVGREVFLRHVVEWIEYTFEAGKIECLFLVLYQG